MAERSGYPDYLKDVLSLDQLETSHLPFPLKGEIHLWTASLDVSAEQLERLQSVLSAEERKRVSYFKFESTQDSYIVTQAVLRMLLSSYLEINPSNVKTGARKKGKPYLMNDPSLCFNLSHSHDLCVYVFSYDSEVGIDLEKIRDLPDIEQLIEKNFTSREKQYLLKDPDNKLSRFFQFWTFKEAYLKATGEGMLLTPENLEFSTENGIIKLQSGKYGFDETNWKFTGFSREENYIGTLAFSHKNPILREMSIDLKKK